MLIQVSVLIFNLQCNDPHLTQHLSLHLLYYPLIMCHSSSNTLHSVTSFPHTCPEIFPPPLPKNHPHLSTSLLPSSLSSSVSSSDRVGNKAKWAREWWMNLVRRRIGGRGGSGEGGWGNGGGGGTSTGGGKEMERERQRGRKQRKKGEGMRRTSYWTLSPCRGLCFTCRRLLRMFCTVPRPELCWGDYMHRSIADFWLIPIIMSNNAISIPVSCWAASMSISSGLSH